MHTFQPYPIESFEFNPFTKIGSDWGALSATDGKSVNAMTISWGGVGVMWRKNVFTAYVRDSRFTKTYLDQSDVFSVTFFEDKYKGALKYLGAVSGKDEDKIKNARLTANHHKGVPFIDEGNLVFICRKLSATKINPEDFSVKAIDSRWYGDKDYHTMYIGEIMEILAR